MTQHRRKPTATDLATVLDQLATAHRTLAEQGADPDALATVLASTTELDAAVRLLREELHQARTTSAGLGGLVVGLERQLHSAEVELGELRTQNARLRAEAVEAVGPEHFRTAVAAIERALHAEGEYLRLAHREVAVHAVLTVLGHRAAPAGTTRVVQGPPSWYGRAGQPQTATAAA